MLLQYACAVCSVSVASLRYTQLHIQFRASTSRFSRRFNPTDTIQVAGVLCFIRTHVYSQSIAQHAIDFAELSGFPQASFLLVWTPHPTYRLVSPLDSMEQTPSSPRQVLNDGDTSRPLSAIAGTSKRLLLIVEAR